MSAPAGLYVHFPYCARRCEYCDFTLTTPRSIPAARYTDALLAELEARLRPGARLGLEAGGVLRSLYVGGGTPSLWPRPELARFMTGVSGRMRLEGGAEVTLEGNPDEVDDAWVGGVTGLGVNRVSLGVQSLDEVTLRRLGRTHDADAAKRSLDALDHAHREGRLTSFSVDLMYGLADQTTEDFLREVDEVVGRWSPPHLSLYALTVEARTVLASRIRKGDVKAPDDGIQAEMMAAASDRLAAHGYTHYEVSSWARPGHVARHNSAYWDLTPYMALGAGAHGFLSGTRYRNEPRPSRYVERALAGEPTEAHVERIDDEMLAVERVMTGLRRLDVGLVFGVEDRVRWGAIVMEEVAAGRLEDDGRRVRLTAAGLRFMDDVVLRFIPERAGA